MSDRVQGALKKRREQEDNSKKYSSSKVQGALNAYRNQVTKELPSIIEDINTRYNTLVDNFNSTSVGFGTDAIENEKTLRGDANREIMSLTAGIEKYRAYLGDEQTDAFLKNLSGLSSAYRNRKSAAEVQSQFKDKAELDAAAENYYYNKRYTDRYSGMTQDERKAKLEELWAARGTGDREYKWLNDYIMLNEDVDETELDQLSRYLDSYNHNINLISGDKYTPDEAKKLLEDEGWGNYDELARKVQFYNDSKAYQSEHYYATLPQNEDFAENSSVDASVSDPEYKYINGINGTSFPERVYNLVSELYDENEIAIYNYLYNTKGKEEADKYIEYIAGTVRDRYAEKIASGYYDSSNWEKLGLAAEAGIDQFSRGIQAIFDEEIAKTPSAVSLASQKVRDTMSGGWGTAYDVVQTVANQVPSTGVALGLSVINPTLGAYVGRGAMSASAGGSAYAEALQSGKSRDEAIKMGILTAASELVTEKALGGVTAFGESLVGKHLDDVVKGINGGLARAGAKLGLSAASEGMEEAVQSVLEQTIIPNLAYGEQNGWGDVEWGEVAYSALLGAISGGVLEGATNIAPNAIAENVKYAKEGKKTTSVEGGTDALYKASEAYLNNIDRGALTKESGKTEASNLQKTYDSLVNGKKTPSNRKVGKLATRLEQARVATNKSDIESRLRSAGIENDNLVGVASSAIYKAMSGEELSAFEYAIVTGEDTVNSVYRALMESDANRSYKSYASKLSTPSTSADKGTTEMPVQGEYEVPENVPVEVKSTKTETTFGEFVTKDDGTLAVKTSDGTEVDVKDVSFNSSDVGIIYETVANIDGITSVEANALASGYRGDVSPSEYAMGVKEAYAYGRYGMPQSQLANSADAYRLSETARNNAYEMGKMAEAASVKAKQEKIDKKAESTKGATKAKAGKVIVEDASIAVDSKTGKIDKSKLNKLQKAGVVTAEFLSEVSSLNVHIFKSRNVDGKLVATINGKVVERAPNGVYFKGTNDIWVDINAGNHGEGTMLWTMAHEISHFIRDKAPSKWKAMADYIMEEYGKNDVDIPALLEKKKESVRKTNESLSESQVSEKAYEELVSDALSEMLDDGSVVDAIAKIKEQDAGLWQTIKDAVANLIQKLKKYLDAYRGRAADTTEAQMLRSIEGAYEKLRQMYAEAFAEASDVGGDIAQFDADSESVAPMLSERTWSESEYVTERDSAARSIADALGVDIKTAYQYIDDVNSIAKLIADNRTRLDYKGGHSTYPVANEVVDEFVEQYGTEPEMMFSARDFSYDELTAMPDIVGTKISSNYSVKINSDGKIDDSWLINEVKKQCTVVKTNSAEPTYYLHSNALQKNIEIVNDGIRHGYIASYSKKGKPASIKEIENARACLNLHDLLETAVVVNLSDKYKNRYTDFAYVMLSVMGVVSPSGNTDYYAVRMIVQDRATDNPILKEVDIYGRLSAVNAKKIDLPHPRRSPKKDISLRYSDQFEYSIADLLNDVKNNFDDTFSEDVYNHFGMKRTENDHFSKHLLFSERNTDSDVDLSPRAVLADALEVVAQNEAEVENLRKYKAELAKIEKIEEELRQQKAEIKDMSFAKGTRDQAYKDKLSKLRLEAQQNQNRIDILDKRLLRLEAAKPLKDLLERERAKVRKRDLEKYRTLMKESHDKQIESMDKRSARGKVQKLILETTEWLNHPKKTDVKCPDFLKAPYLDFLESLVFPEGDTPTDIASKSLRSGKDMTKQDLKFVNALNSLANSIEAIQKTQDATSEDNPNVPDEAIQGYLDLPQSFVNELKEMARSIDAAMKIGDFNLVDMSSADFKAIAKKIRTLNHSIRELSTLYSNGRFAKIEELGAESIDYFESLGHKGTKIVGEDFLNWDNALPYYAFKKFGDAGLAVFKELQDAQGTLANHAKSIFDFKEKTWTDNEAKAWADEVHSIEISSGTIELAATDIMTIYCLSKREQAQGHLYGDGIKLPGKRKGLKETIETGTKLTENDVQNIIGTLSKRQIEVADAIQRFMSTVCAEWGNEISMKRFLTREFTEPNYFPIETTDDGRPVKDQAVQQTDLYRLLNISATKETIKNARNAIVIHNIFEVFAGHTSDMAKLNAFGLPLLDFMKWINYNQLTDDGKVSLRAKMRDAFGDGAKKYALNLIKDVNGRYTDNADHPLFMHFMRTTKAANVGGSLRVALLQFTAYPRAAMVLDKRSLALALVQSPKKLSSAIGKMQKYSGIALWKSFGFYDTNIARSVEAQIAGKKSVREAIVEIGFKLPEIADNLTWGSLWNACEYEIARANKHMSTKSEEFYKAVAEKFDEVVYATQVVDSVLTKSQLMRSKSGVTQTFTAYMSEPTVAANILMDAAWEVKSAKRRGVITKAAWKHFRKAASVYGVCAVVQALAGALADAYRDDDEEKTFGEKFLAQLRENGVQEVNPFNKIPFLSDLSELISSKFGIGYFSTDSMTHTWLANGAKAFDAWKALLDEDSDKTLYNAIYETARFASSATGISASNAMREVVDMWNHIAGAIDDDLKIRKTDRTSTQNFNRLYNAIVSGDDAKATKIMGELEKAEFDEGQIASGLVKALYTNDPEIITTASAYIGGDLDAFTDMVDSLVGMGFDEDTAAKAIRSIVSKVKSAAQSKADGDTEAYEKKVDELVDLGYDKEQLMYDIDTIEITPGGEGKEVSIYVKDDYKLAYGTANEDMMAEIEEDVRETMLANGKTDEDVDKKILSWKKEYIKEKHLDGTMSEAAATKSLMEADAKLSENDAYWLLKKWRISSQHADEEDYSYSKYNEWYDAIMAGENLKQIINEHITHTDYKDKETKSEHEKRVKSALASSVISHFKPLFVAATTKSERANIKARCLWAYEALGYNRSDKSKDIDAWLKD